MQLEIKAANAAVAAGGVVDSDDPYTHWIIASVTGVKDEVNDVIEPGAYTKTLAERKPKVIKDHDWAKRLGRAVEIKELLPGDPRLPKTTARGEKWPADAGALMAKVRLFKGTRDGDEAAARWAEEGEEQQFSIGYSVPKGKSTTRAGIRYIHELKCFEISDVLWGAMPLGGIMPGALATKMLADPDLDADLVDGDTDGDTDTDLPEIDAQETKTTEPAEITVPGYEIGSASTGATVTWTTPRGFATDPATNTAGGDVEVKYDTSPVGTPGGRRNWVDEVGGLPKFIRAIAHALIRQGRSEQQAIQIAVGTVKRWARGGGKVSEKTRAKAAAAVAEWESKKAEARGKKTIEQVESVHDIVDLGGWDPTLEVGEHAAHAGVAVEVKSTPRLPGTVEEQLDILREAVTLALRGPVRPTTDAGDQAPAGGRRYDWNHVNIDGTYRDHVVATRVRWDGPTGDDSESFQVPYRWGPDGDIQLGEPLPVELTLTVIEQDDDGGEEYAEEFKTDLTLDSVAPAVLALTDAAALAVRTLRADEVKAGRVLSAANATRLQTALQQLVDVLAAAGVHLGDDDEKPAKAETKADDETTVGPAVEGTSPVAGLGDLPDPHAFVAQLLAEARG